MPAQEEWEPIRSAVDAEIKRVIVGTVVFDVLRNSSVVIEVMQGAQRAQEWVAFCRREGVRVLPHAHHHRRAADFISIACCGDDRHILVGD